MLYILYIVIYIYISYYIISYCIILYYIILYYIILYYIYIMYICLYICIQPNMVHIPPYISKHWYSQNTQLTLEIRELQQSSKTVDLKWFIQRFGDSMVVSLSTKAAKIIGTNRIFLRCDSALFKGESSVSKIENSHLQLKVKAAPRMVTP